MQASFNKQLVEFSEEINKRKPMKIKISKIHINLVGLSAARSAIAEHKNASGNPTGNS